MAITTQKTITDMTDYESVPIIATEAPESPAIGQMWLDVSGDEPVGKTWSGSAWVAAENLENVQWAGILAQWQNGQAVNQFAAQIELLQNEGIQALVKAQVQRAMGADDDTIAQELAEIDPDADTSTITLESVMQVLLGRITAQVSEAVAGVETHVSTVEQTADGWALTLSELIDAASAESVDTTSDNALARLVTRFSMDSDGLVIRSSNSNYNIKLSNTGLYLRNGNSNLAWFATDADSSIMRIATAQIKAQLNLGHLQINVNSGSGAITVGYNSGWASM